jgi:hypothetical protein
MPNNHREYLLRLFEREYDTFLSKQKEYEYSVQIHDLRIELNMKKTSPRTDIPDNIDCTFMFLNDIPQIIINGSGSDCGERMIETYIKNYIKKLILEENKNEELTKAADMLGLTINDVANKKLIKERFKLIIKELHPDKWINENDPAVTKNAAEAVVQITEAKDILLKYPAGDLYENQNKQ